MTTTIIQVFSDYTCPFCRLGEVALNRAAAKTGAQIVWRAHQLRVSGPPRLDPQNAAMKQGWREQILPWAERLGVEMRQPTRLPLTRRAHEAAAWARSQGRFDEYHQAIFRAYFVEDADLDEVETLTGLARRLGLPPEDLAAALREHRFAEEVDEDLLVGQTYGVTGVPTFVIGGCLLYGVQEEATLVRAVEAARAGRPVLELKKLPMLPVNITRKF
jgi:predicted DsbA family dithiol-disulfide isomerase